MDAIIVDFEDRAAGLRQIGGKGLAMGAMYREGLPVPPGFIICTAAYMAYVEHNRLLPGILEQLAQADGDEQELLHTERVIRQWFKAGAMPDDLRNAIIAQSEGMPADAWAVRSSATCEDLPNASFAGLHDSFLNIRGKDELLHAVRDTWASLWSARAIRYRLQHNIDPTEVAMAVIVQKMAHAEASGVLFSINPVRADRDSMLLTSTWGLGQALVGGEITPDTYELQRQPVKVIARQVAHKLTRLVPNPTGNGIISQAVPRSLANKPSLSSNSLHQLAALGQQIERQQGCPVDVEWAVSGAQEGHRIAILQARPITNLPTNEVRWETRLPHVLFSRSSLAEQIPNPVTPLFGTLGLAAINRAVSGLGASVFGGTVANYGYQAVHGYVFQLTPMSGYSFKMLLSASYRQMTSDFIHSREVWHTALAELKRKTTRIRAERPTEQKAKRLLQHAITLMEASAHYFTVLQLTSIPNASTSEMVFSFLYKLVKEKTDPTPERLLYGLPTHVLAAEQAAWDMARWVARRPSLAAIITALPVGATLPLQAPQTSLEEDWLALHERLASFMHTFGANSFDVDFAQPSLAEMPGVALGLVRAGLDGSARDPYLWQRQCDALREETFARIRKDLRWLPMGWLTRPFGWACRSAADREDSLAGMFWPYPVLRAQLAELGQRLQQQHVIATADDVYWLLEEELHEAAEQLDAHQIPGMLGTYVDLRKAEWHENLSLQPPRMFPRVGWIEKAVPWFVNAGGQGNTLVGTPASPGRYSGVARVLTTPADFADLQKGDVLVACATTPAWTPLFARAGAIVTDIGGPLSHSSIIAREYGLPAVVACGNASRRIRSGQRVTVDGNAGHVILSQDPSGQSEA